LLQWGFFDMLEREKLVEWTKIGRIWGLEAGDCKLPRLPRVAAQAVSFPQPECLAGLVAAPLEGQKSARAAKFHPRSRNGRTARDALSSV
jgi:hypothetical protein